LAGLLSVLLLGGAAGAKKPAPKPKHDHLYWAEKIVGGIKPKDMNYQHGTQIVRWKGIDGAKKYESHADCSGFLDALLKRAYGLSDQYLNQWMGAKKRPLAHHYFDAIKLKKKFNPVVRIQDVRPGDFIAIRYLPGDPENKDNNTGHVMLVAQKPRQKKATAPVVPQTHQWEVTVIDQSRSGHGPKDTRGKHAGVGRGVFRLYADKAGKIQGYSWSTSAKSKYRSQKQRPLVIGRLHLGR
jgi:hypothetical protein